MKKITLVASVFALSSAAAVAAPQNDSESLTVNATVNVNATCQLAATGTHSVTIPVAAGQVLNSPEVPFTYGCNAPYSLTLKATNGALTHTVSGATMAYTLKFNGGTVAFDANNEAVLDTVADYNSLANKSNATGKVEFTAPAQDQIIAGTYEESLTLTVASNL